MDGNTNQGKGGSVARVISMVLALVLFWGGAGASGVFQAADRAAIADLAGRAFQRDSKVADLLASAEAARGRADLAASFLPVIRPTLSTGLKIGVFAHPADAFNVDFGFALAFDLTPLVSGGANQRVAQLEEERYLRAAEEVARQLLVEVTRAYADWVYARRVVALLEAGAEPLKVQPAGIAGTGAAPREAELVLLRSRLDEEVALAGLAQAARTTLQELVGLLRFHGVLPGER